MTRIELTTDQVAALRRALELYLGELRMEIADTDQKDFRDGLKQEKGLLADVLTQLEGHDRADASRGRTCIAAMAMP